MRPMNKKKIFVSNQFIGKQLDLSPNKCIKTTKSNREKRNFI